LLWSIANFYFGSSPRGQANHCRKRCRHRRRLQKGTKGTITDFPVPSLISRVFLSARARETMPRISRIVINLPWIRRVPRPFPRSSPFLSADSASFSSTPSTLRTATMTPERAEIAYSLKDFPRSVCTARRKISNRRGHFTVLSTVHKTLLCLAVFPSPFLRGSPERSSSRISIPSCRSIPRASFRSDDVNPYRPTFHLSWKYICRSS